MRAVSCRDENPYVSAGDAKREGDRQMLKFDFENSVGYWLILATRDMRRSLEAELDDQEITLRQWEVLAWLSIEERMTQSELAERLGVEAPTLAGILDRMERDGWVERYGCPHDRRKKRLQATSKADAIWNRTVECAYRVRARATQGISAEELLQLKSLCQKIRTNLELEPAPISPCPDELEPVASETPASVSETLAASEIKLG
jgi:DNA-binding MarR family transcriptional regulator